jgi:cytochrome c-type biogenesis protein CcmH
VILGVVSALVSAQGNEALEKEAKRLETLIIAPCCWRQPVSDHQSPAATEVKSEIRQMLAEGKTEEEILAHYVEIHGAKILSIPPQEGFNRTAFLMPALFTVLGLVVVGLVLRKWHSSQAKAQTASETPTEVPLDDEMSRRIQRELDAMDET